jgi:hypothetical protein
LVVGQAAGEQVTVPVQPQLAARPPDEAMTCSCRCDGPSGTGPFCACPRGSVCAFEVSTFGLGDADGTYCVPSESLVIDPDALDFTPCVGTLRNCEGR